MTSRSLCARPRAHLGLVAILLAAVISGCARAPDSTPAAPPVEVKAVTVQPSATETYADKVGEVRGSQEVDLRARVSGILLATHFEDGSLVKEGQLLFSIDAREFRAQVASAQARLASAEANLSRARQDVERYRPLLAEEAIARQVGIDRVLAEVLPEDKAAEVKKLQAEGKIVAMVGDGINDAPSLAASDIGVAMGKGTDIAIESADLVLMKGQLSRLVSLIRLSKKTLWVIRENLFWAFVYNIIGIPVAAGILFPFTGFLLNPMIAGAAMALSSVSVVSNSLRLKLKTL